MSKVFQRTGGLTPRRSVFNLSHEKKLTCDFGQLIPVVCEEMVPGDKFQLGEHVVIRLQPLVAPIMHEINVYFHAFFLPHRVAWSGWEEFITGGTEGPQVPEVGPVLPRWLPTAPTCAKYSLWDYLGFPVDVIPPLDDCPVDFPRVTYNKIFNEFYRDQNIQDEVALTNESILLRNYEKDYFTSSLPWQQRGVAPAIPLGGYVPVIGLGKGTTSWNTVPVNVYETGGSGTVNYQKSQMVSDSVANTQFYINEDSDNPGYPGVFADLQRATTFDVADLRLAFQIQKWMERNARAGVRYTEFLNVHFGVNPRDDRLQRPEYIGGAKFPVMISEVLSTVGTTEVPQGNLAGHGMTADGNSLGSYFAQEFGTLMVLMSIMPRTAYQQGIERQWLSQSRYDYYFPEFANLSEQAVLQKEIYMGTDNTENNKIFGYIGRYDHMRVRRSMVCADMRDTFDYWHLGRKFVNAPYLTEAFIQCNPALGGAAGLKRIFAVQDEPGFIVNLANIIRAVRPMPIMSSPGLVDHN